MKYPEQIYVRLRDGNMDVAATKEELLDQVPLGETVEFAKYVYVGLKAAQKQVMVVPTEPTSKEPYGER